MSAHGKLLYHFIITFLHNSQHPLLFLGFHHMGASLMWVCSCPQWTLTTVACCILHMLSLQERPMAIKLLTSPNCITILMRLVSSPKLSRNRFNCYWNGGWRRGYVKGLNQFTFLAQLQAYKVRILIPWDSIVIITRSIMFLQCWESNYITWVLLGTMHHRNKQHGLLASQQRLFFHETYIDLKQDIWSIQQLHCAMQYSFTATSSARTRSRRPSPHFAKLKSLYAACFHCKQLMHKFVKPGIPAATTCAY